MSHLMFVAVPGGRTKTGEGLLRVLVVPVLDGGGTLADHAMATWPPPSLVDPAARLLVEVAPEPTATPTASLQLRPGLSVVPDLWEQFFGSIDVRAPGAPVSRTLDVTPTNAQATEVVGTYREVARLLTSEDERPAFDAMARGRAGGLAGTGPLAVPQAGTGTPSERAVDFHLATSLLREHPAVLRALGLIIDLVVPASAVSGTGALGGAGTSGGTSVVRVSWPEAPTGLPAVQPRWTRFVRPRFLPAPGANSDLHPGGGMVALAREEGGEPIWRLHTIDVDHAMRGLAAPAEDGLPALRTAGVLLTRDHRELALAGRESRQGGSPDDVLVAEQLCLGYRVDARIFGGEWHSLCRRSSRYRVNGVTFAEKLLEEGHVKVAGGVDRGDHVLRTDEVVTRWDGWSLAVPRPQLTERPPDSTTPATALPFDLDTTGIEVEPRTLLKLRFGQNYQLRARVADVAGGGPPLEDPSLDECDSETVQFRRLEPVLPPDVRLPPDAADFGPGASAMALVIRSAEGLTDSVADTTRELIPPSATFEVVERHGRLDGPPEASLELLAREDLPDPASGGVVAFVRGAPGEPPRDIEPQDWTSSRPGPPPLDPWPDLRPKRVTLRARGKDEPTLDWESDDLLVVRLGPAEEATLEISSLIDEKTTGHFAISNWLHDGGSVSAAEKLFADGRHPMATPAHRISVRHAVRAPLGEPAGDLEVLREEGSTFATIAPEGNPFVGVDTASTLAVEVTASWAPVDDSLDPPVTGRPVGRITVGRADSVLASLAHEFGDTKHRMVTYTLTAHSRFRDCFPGTDDESSFRTRGSIGPVIVDSSARPVVPVVRSVVPAFVWQEEVNGAVTVRRRLGHRLRIELAAPWFTTGDGEQLAVLCGDATASAEVAELVTQAGRDPLWLPGVPPRFPLAVGGVEGIMLAEGPTVMMVPHGVFEVGGSAFADVTFPETSSYSPLVQLALARYQRNSLNGLWISPVVRTDFVPLLPDRTLTLTRAEGSVLVVRLEGMSPFSPRLNRVDAVVEQRVDSPAGGLSGSLTVGEDSAWTVVTSASGTVGSDLSVSLPSGVGAVRVRVREVEMIGRDTSATLGSVGEIDERVVFTDTVELGAT